MACYSGRKISKAGTHSLMSKSGSEYLRREDLPNCFVERADQLCELCFFECSENFENKIVLLRVKVARIATSN